MKFNYKFENKAGMSHYENDFINTKIKNIQFDKKKDNKYWKVDISYKCKRKIKSFACKKYGNYQAKIKALKQLEEWDELREQEKQEKKDDKERKKQERKDDRERKKKERKELYNKFIVTSYMVDCSGICDICDEKYSICVCRFE